MTQVAPKTQTNAPQHAMENGGELAPQTDSLDAILADQLAPVMQLLEQRQAEHDDLVARTKVLAGEVRRIEKVVRIIAPNALPESAQQAAARARWKGGKGSGANQTTVASWRLDAVEKWMRENPGGHTTRELADATGMSNASASVAVRMMRDQERLRVAGKQGNATLWRLFDVN